MQATDEGRLAEEIAPVTVSSKKGDSTVEGDEGRPEATLETLAELKPISEGGTHTAGNSPGVNDGAGALVLAAEEWATANDREWLATILAQAAVADDSPTSRALLPRPPSSRSRRWGSASTTSTCSRSTRRSPRWP